MRPGCGIELVPGSKRIDIDSVLTQAMFRFWRHGYAATSMGDLTTAMEIPRQSLYNLFGSKRHLFLCALAHYDREFRQTTRSELATRASPRAAVLDLLDEAVSSVVHDRCHDGCFVVNAALEMAPHDTDVAAFVVGVFAVEAEFIRNSIERAQALGEISAEVAPERVAKSLLGLSVGIRVLARSWPDEQLLRTIAKQAEELLPAPC